MRECQSLSAQVRRARNIELREQGLPVPVEPIPCDGCHHNARCAAKQEACEAYRIFSIYRDTARCAVAPRQPTAAIYAAIFGEEDEIRPRKARI
jgi:hypothetical protein